LDVLEGQILREPITIFLNPIILIRKLNKLLQKLGILVTFMLWLY